MNRLVDALYSSISQVHPIGVITYGRLDSPYLNQINHSQNCMSFPNQIKIVREIRWYTRLHVVNHWVPIHSEGKNNYMVMPITISLYSNKNNLKNCCSSYSITLSSCCQWQMMWNTPTLHILTILGALGVLDKTY